MFGQKKPSNLRGYSRWKIDQFLGLYDERKSTFLGRIDDLSIDGMRVISEASLPVGHIVKLAVEMLGKDGECETFYLRSRCVWVGEDAGDGVRCMGFQFSGISPAVIKKIQRIIDDQQSSRST